MGSHLLGSSPHLSPLTLETSNALLPPLGSHLELWVRNEKMFEIGRAHV